MGRKILYAFRLDSISSLVWSPNSSYLVSADTDRFIRVWHNMPGMKEKLIRNNEELKSATSEALKVKKSLQM